MLPRESKKKGIAWWLPASVAAAIVLLFASLWLLNKPVTNTEQVVKANKEIPGAGLSDKASTSEINTASNNSHPVPFNKEGETLPVSAQNNRNDLRYPAKVLLKNEQSGVSEFNLEKGKTFTEIEKTQYSLMPQQFKGLMLQNNDSLLFGNPELSHLNILVPEPSIQKNDKNKALEENQGSRFSLGLSISPDINSVSDFNESSFGNSFGLAANYRISPRLSVSTGIAYSTKVYSAQPYQYKAPWASSNAGSYAQSIDADCRVLDVPVNLNYNFSKSPKRTMFASAGVSSYFMLKEKYTLIAKKSQPGYPAYPNRSYDYSNQNQHLLSVLNLSVGMAKPLSKQTSLVIEPYARLPLTGIGQGEVNLKSIGLNLQLQYNLRKKDKPNSTSVIAVQ